MDNKTKFYWVLLATIIGITGVLIANISIGLYYVTLIFLMIGNIIALIHNFKRFNAKWKKAGIIVVALVPYGNLANNLLALHHLNKNQ